MSKSTEIAVQTSQEIVEAGDARLMDIAVEFKGHMESVERSRVAMGDLLLEAKDLHKYKRGKGWGKYCKEQLSIAEGTANQYIKEYKLQSPKHLALKHVAALPSGLEGSVYLFDQSSNGRAQLWSNIDKAIAKGQKSVNGRILPAVVKSQTVKDLEELALAVMPDEERIAIEKKAKKKAPKKTASKKTSDNNKKKKAEPKVIPAGKPLTDEEYEAVKMFVEDCRMDGEGDTPTIVKHLQYCWSIMSRNGVLHDQLKPLTSIEPEASC